MTTTRDDLLRAVLLEPDEDAPRLVLADFLEEYGGPDDRTRAEFIRVQCELARLERGGRSDPDPIRTAEVMGRISRGGGTILRAVREHCLRERERELRGPVSPASGGVHRESLWVEEAFGPDRVHARPGDPDVIRSWEFRRGFVEAVTLDAAAWLAHGDDLLAAAPLREVRLTTRPRVHEIETDWYSLFRPGQAPRVHAFDDLVRSWVGPLTHDLLTLALLRADYPGPDGRLRFVLPT